MKIKTFFILILFCAVILVACEGNTIMDTETVTETVQPTLEPTQTLEHPTVTSTVTPTETPTNTPEPPSTETPGPEASSNTISYAKQVQPIFNKSCISCHGIKAIKEGLDLRTFDGLLAGSLNGSVITPGDAENSFFIKQIVSGEMPWRGKAPKVTPEELQILFDWVNQGALNN